MARGGRLVADEGNGRPTGVEGDDGTGKHGGQDAADWFGSMLWAADTLLWACRCPSMRSVDREMVGNRPVGCFSLGGGRGLWWVGFGRLAEVVARMEDDIPREGEAAKGGDRH